MTDTSAHIIVTLAVIVVLATATYLSGFQPELIALLSASLGYILGYWFGTRANGNGRTP